MSYVASWVDPFLKEITGRRVSGEAETGFRSGSTPAVDVLETPEAWVILADMPGVESSGVDVSVKEGFLTLTGQRTAGKEAEAGRIQSEREVGPYQRVFKIDLSKMEVGSISASIKNGVLRVWVPKAAPARVHRIDVKGE
jgi:HSP20 family protein